MKTVSAPQKSPIAYAGPVSTSYFCIHGRPGLVSLNSQITDTVAAFGFQFREDFAVME